MRTPFIDLGLPGVYAPQPAFITHAVTPAGLFYAGSMAFGRRFPVQLGYRVEAYVGRQLGSVAGAVVLPEIAYGRPERKSVDWLVTTPDALLLVECKSQRLPLDARSGGASLLTELAARLNKARAQISATADLVRTGAAPFDVLPGDRPVVGLVVTSEPLYLANSPVITDHLAPTHTPTLVASIRELEQLVAGRDARELGRTLLDVVTNKDRSAWTLETALPDPPRRNALLDEAWRELNAPLRAARDA